MKRILIGVIAVLAVIVFLASNLERYQYRLWARQTVQAGAEYVVNNQAPNGELPYQYSLNEDLVLSSEPVGSYIRQIAGVGMLYNSCQYLNRIDLCEAADEALMLYIGERTVNGSWGRTVVSGGQGKLGGDALLIDAIYKRNLAMGSDYRGFDLKIVAVELGENIIWLKRDETDIYFYHAFDFNPIVYDEEYFVPYFNGEALMALWQLYELTGEDRWRQEADALNSYMLTQEATQDHWHAYAMMLSTNHELLNDATAGRAMEILALIDSQQSNHLRPNASIISTATKIEAMAAIKIALINSQREVPQWLDERILEYIAFVASHQLPKNTCGIERQRIDTRLFGGFMTNCSDETNVRIDGQQHFINGLITYMRGP